MVTQTHRVMDATRRRITSSYRIALTLIALMIILTAAVTGYLVKAQVNDVSMINLAGRQRMLLQQIALSTHLLTETTGDAHLAVLQYLRKATQDMQQAHDILISNAIANSHRLWHESIIDNMYLEPPLAVDRNTKDFLAHVQALLRLTPDQITVTQPSILYINQQATGPLLKMFEAITAQNESEAIARFGRLYNVVLILSGVALLMIVVVATVVLRPAIMYVEQAQHRLQELNQLKGDFLANMSHEIRTPMNGIFGMTELLMDSSLNTRQQHYVRTLQNSADHLLGLINDILDFSKLEAGQMKLDPIHFNLMATIEDVLEVLSVRAREKQLELLLRYAPDVPQFIVADPGRVRQVLFNLVGNAIKFTDKGYVLVHVERAANPTPGDSQSWMQLRIEDTGIGIPENKVNSLFEKFMQVESGSARARQGTGLGLAICRNLVTLMGGSIKVTSTVGVGTVFNWSMPLIEASKPAPVKDYDTALKGRRVLLVDDLAPNRALYKETLMIAGAACLTAENVREAMSILEYEHDNNRTIDVVLTDYMMPGETGLDLATRIRSHQHLHNLPLLMLTSVGDQGLIRRLDEAGVNACLNKPVTRQQLIDTLANVLDAAARGIKQSLITAEASSAMSVNRLMSRDRVLYGTHVLLVEDNRVNLEITSEILMRLGCQVSTAESGIEALKQVRAHAFDLIFMDCQMPEMDGFEAARHIVAMKAANEIAPVPVVALTANALKGDRERCLESGMDDYLSKPVRKANLEAILLKWLREKIDQRNGTTTPAPVAAIQLVTPPPALALQEVLENYEGIDSNAFINAREMLGDKLATVITYYLEDADGFINRIAEAVANHDPAAAILPAHTLKSSSRQLGAVALAELAARTEAIARSPGNGSNAEDIAQLLPALREALQHIRPFFQSTSAA